jgi:hypothetical protein
MEQVKIWADSKTKEMFKKACKMSGISMSGDLSRYMEERAGALKRNCEKNLNCLSNRGGRRKEIASIILRIEQIRDTEQDYQSRIPESLQSSPAYEAADQAIEALDQVIEQLRDVF